MRCFKIKIKQTQFYANRFIRFINSVDRVLRNKITRNMKINKNKFCYSSDKFHNGGAQ